MPIIKYRQNTTEYADLAQTMNAKTIDYFFNKMRDIEKATKQNLNVGKAFEIYVASVMTGKGYDQAWKENTLLDKFGNSLGDGGIDVFLINKNKKILTLVQTKTKDYDEIYIEKMIRTYDNYIKFHKKPLHNDNQGIQKIRNAIARQQIKKVEYIFIGTNEVDAKAVKQRFRGFNVEVMSINTLIQHAGMKYYENNYNEKFEIVINSQMSGFGLPENSEKKAWFVHVNGKDLIEQFANLNNFAIDLLFEENIRNRVSKTKFVNEFKKTIKENPNLFHFFNNGITIVSTHVEPGESILTLKNPQIINGQQTVRALIEIYREYNPQIDISTILIPIKIIEEEDKDIIKQIARYSNNQTAVKQSELNFVDDNYKKIVLLAERSGYALKGKKGTTSRSEILKFSIENGELSLNEVIRAHSAAFHPKLYLGESKNRISNVVNDYFNDEKLVKQVLKETTFKKLIELISNYEWYLKNITEKEKEKIAIKNGISKSKATKEANKNIRHLKFGISVYYNLLNRDKTSNAIDNYIYDITFNDKESDGTINIFKNNAAINAALERQLKLNSY